MGEVAAPKKGSGDSEVMYRVFANDTGKKRRARFQVGSARHHIKQPKK